MFTRISLTGPVASVSVKKPIQSGGLAMPTNLSLPIGIGPTVAAGISRGTCATRATISRCTSQVLATKVSYALGAFQPRTAIQMEAGIGQFADTNDCACLLLPTTTADFTSTAVGETVEILVSNSSFGEVTDKLSVERRFASALVFLYSSGTLRPRSSNG